MRWKGGSPQVRRSRCAVAKHSPKSVGRIPVMGCRVYRTAGGFRLLVTSDTFDPMSTETIELLKAFGSDPLYIRLCKAQECFRRRLSAKFWRCGADRPPSRFPWAIRRKRSNIGSGRTIITGWQTNSPPANLSAACGVPTIDEAVRADSRNARPADDAGRRHAGVRQLPAFALLTVRTLAAR